MKTELGANDEVTTMFGERRDGGSGNQFYDCGCGQR
jgi:hypothetical protein